jgi:hypothetical protein
MKGFSICLGLGLAALPAFALSACGTSDATFAFLSNAYPASPKEVDAGDEVDAGNDRIKQTVVYRGWWLVTYFGNPVPAGQASQPLRVVTDESGVSSAGGNDTAFVVLAKDWAPSSGTPPTELLALKSHAPLYVARGDTLDIVVSDDTFDGNCAAGKPLSQADADEITQEIFPAEFAGMHYDAATCTLTPLPPDAGSEAGSDAGGG